MKQIPCQIFSRITGYIKPVQNWNNGKSVEFEQRHLLQSVQ